MGLGGLLAMGMNIIGGLAGSAVGHPPPLPPPLPPPMPAPPPQAVPGPPGPAGAPGEVRYITFAPPPDPTREPEKLTTYGIIGIVMCLMVLICCVAAGIGFYCWQNQKNEAVKRANETRDRDFYAMEGGGGGRGRRGRGRRGSSGTSGTTGTTRTRGHKTRRH